MNRVGNNGRASRLHFKLCRGLTTSFSHVAPLHLGRQVWWEALLEELLRPASPWVRTSKEIVHAFEADAKKKEKKSGICKCMKTAEITRNKAIRRPSPVVGYPGAELQPVFRPPFGSSWTPAARVEYGL